MDNLIKYINMFFKNPFFDQQLYYNMKRNANFKKYLLFILNINSITVNDLTHNKSTLKFNCRNGHPTNLFIAPIFLLI